MRIHIKVIMSILMFLGFVLVFSNYILVGAMGETPSPIAPQKISSPVVPVASIYLPLLVKNYCVCQPVESPFSISIAQLHLVTTAGISTAEQKRSEEQYMAWYTQAFPSLVAALKASGAGYTRVYIRWFDIEPDEPLPGQPPTYDTAYWRWYDDRLIQLSQAGIKVIATIGAAPAWANDAAYSTTGTCTVPPITAAHQQEYQRFLTDLVTHYSQPPFNINHWEIFNETDNITMGRAEALACYGNFGSDYANILEISYPTIKNIDPTATVLMAGVAYDWFTEYDGPFNRYFPDTVMQAGGASNFDVLNFHYFPDFHLEWERWNPPNNPPTCGNVEDGVGQSYDGSGIDVIAKKNHFTNRMKVCFGVDKPVWLTETGQHGTPGDPISLALQADYVIQVYARGLAAGIQNITWFQLATPPGDPNNQGLLDFDFSPQPAFISYQTMTQELQNFKFEKTLNITGGEAYVFLNSCQVEKTVAWGNNVPLAFASTTSLRKVDYQGAETIIQDGGVGDLDGTTNGSIQIMLTPDPVFINAISN